MSRLLQTCTKRASSAVAEPPNAPPSRQGSTADRDTSFEGDSSFMTHSKQATQAFKASLASTPQINVDDALSDAVANLQKALDSTDAQPPSPSHSQESAYDDESHGLSALPMPPSHVVLKLLKRAK
ncbi:MAG: hypothetical protein L6R42_010530, partial [Xanthoria sp. 1 TBL-2021]